MIREVFRPWKTILFVAGAIAIVVLFVSMAEGASVTLENCQPNTWVGGVRWLDNKTDYESVPELELKQVGSLTVDLPSGEYAITHFRPSFVGRTADGRFIAFPGAILDFQEVIVADAPVTFYFGCGE